MAILLDQHTRLIVQGLTGREGTFHAKTAAAYHTNVVGGATPGKGGTTMGTLLRQTPTPLCRCQPIPTQPDDPQKPIQHGRSRNNGCHNQE